MAEKNANDELASGDVRVVARVNGVTNNGQVYAKGQSFAMERSMAEAHAKAGQVEMAAAATK